MILYIILENDKPVKNADINDEFTQLYDETGDETLLMIGEEIIGVWDNKDLALSWKENLELLYPERKFTIGELYLVNSTLEWN